MNHHFEHNARSTGMHRRKIHLNRDLSPNLPGLGDSTSTTSDTKAAATSASSSATSASSSSSTQAATTSPSSSSSSDQKTTASSSTSNAAATTTSNSASSTDTSAKSSTSSDSSSASTKASTTGASSSSASSATKATSSGLSTSAAASTIVSTPVSSVILSTPSLGSSTSSAPTSTSTASSGSSDTGSIVGGILGALGGILVVAVIVSFVIRRLRNRHNEEAHFDAAQFRRSAALLDDEFGTDNDNNNFSARPPTMIARHMAHSPALPPATYGNYPGADPYAQPYGTEQFGGDPYNQQYGAYPSYAQNMAPVYGVNPGETFPASNPIAPSYSAGSVREMDQTTANNAYLNRQPTYSGSNSNSTLSDITKQYIDMNRVPAAAAPIEPEHDEEAASPLPNPFGAADAHADAPADAAPVASATHGEAIKRPDTVYNPDDAYGGM